MCLAISLPRISSATMRCANGLEPPSAFCIAMRSTTSPGPIAQPTLSPGARIFDTVPSAMTTPLESKLLTGGTGSPSKRSRR